MSSRGNLAKDKKSHDDFAFGGPWGALGIQISLPLFILFVVAWGLQMSLDAGLRTFSVPSWTISALLPVAWFISQSFLYLLPFGPVLQGLPLKNGKRLDYRCNGLHSFLLTSAVLPTSYFVLRLPIHLLYENILGLAATTIVYSFAISTYLYVKSFRATGIELAEHGTTGYAVYDYFMGRELNPRDGKFDWKFFCELRPGLTGWVVLEISMLVWEFHKYGYVSPALVLLATFHAWYVADALWHEPAVLSTKDIIEEGFGSMLVFGDLAWVPFFYSSQAQYLLAAQPVIPYWALALSLVLHVAGYVIFRQSNLQKNWFRNNPADLRLQSFGTIPTGVAGKNLLCGGWWSVVRHPNYLGDLLMALSWTSLCGFGSIYPFLYCGYFFVLLIHREIRDEQVCLRKYGQAWERYRTRVPYRIFPFIF